MKYYLIKQKDESDCGAACIATIARFYGKRISVTKIRTIAGTDVDGTSGKGIIKACQALDLTCKAMFSKDKHLQTDYPFPIIAHINRNGFEHYLVIYKVKKNKILAADPADSLQWISIDDFQKWWTGVFFIISPTKNFKKTNEYKTFLNRFIHFILENKKLAIEILLASFLITILGIMGAFYFRYLIDDVIYSGLPLSLLSISLAYLAVLIFQNLLSFARNNLIIFLGNKIDAVLTLGYFNHILHLPLDFFMTRKSGEILSRLGDIKIIKNALSSMSVGIILDCTMFIFGGIVLFAFNSSLFWLAIIPTVLSAAIVLIFTKSFRKLIHDKAVIEAEKYSHFVETINGISTVKALSTESDSYDKAELKIIDAIRKDFSLSKLSNFQNTLQNFLTQAGSLSVYWYGSYLIMKGSLSLGELISFVTLLGFFLGPLTRLITLQPQLQELEVAGQRVGEILDLPEEKEISNGLITNKKIEGSIHIQNLSFSYGTRGLTLNNISMEIKAGEKVAIVGPSGSGKTTLLKLIMKFYKAESGNIYLDDQNIDDIDTESYRNYFGYVPQEILLFSGTIAENIAWGNENATPEDIFNAAKEAQALDFISKLNNRFATMVGERGASLSGGERQRIAIARIILRKPKVLVLDEATSNLDSLSETSIMKTINSIGKQMTTVIVAHRLSTIRNCDKIFVLKDGKLSEEGNHESLIEKNGIYAQMWKSQTEGQE
jgi:ATP-binding cassette subfamily B protein